MKQYSTEFNILIWWEVSKFNSHIVQIQGLHILLLKQAEQ